MLFVLMEIDLKMMAYDWGLPRFEPSGFELSRVEPPKVELSKVELSKVGSSSTARLNRRLDTSVNDMR